MDDIYGRTYHASLISKAIIHPDFKKNNLRLFSDMIGDLALLVMKTPVPNIANFSVLTLPANSTKLPTALQTMGYGTTSESGTQMSNNLRVVGVSLVDRARCNVLLNKLNPRAYNVTVSTVCAGVLTGGHDSCQGDSGGPLIIKGKSSKSDVLVGLTSFGEGCARKNAPAGYTNVQLYTPWIKEQLNSLTKASIIDKFELPTPGSRDGGSGLPAARSASSSPSPSPHTQHGN